MSQLLAALFRNYLQVVVLTIFSGEIWIWIVVCLGEKKCEGGITKEGKNTEIINYMPLKHCCSLRIAECQYYI